MHKLLLTLISITLMYSCSKQPIKTINYSGEDLSDKVTLLRDANTQSATLNIDVNGKWSVYSVNKTENIDLKSAIHSGSGKKSISLNISPNEHSYFFIETGDGTMILSDKHLPLKGGFNFRDLGGVKTKDGHFTKWGKVFRSDELKDLTSEDLTYLESIPIISVVDFRTTDEIKKSPDRNPKSLEENYAYSINPGSLFDLEKIAELSEEELVEKMKETNAIIVTDTAFTSQYRKYFALLQDTTKVPLMFHCTAGKDRTGMGAALFLFALGVDEERIFNDYLESNIYLKNKYASIIEKHPNLQPLLEVRREYLQHGLDTMINTYGSIDKFLTKELDVDLDLMKKLYLY